MSNGSIWSTASAEDYVKDPAMQETPIADHLLISKDMPDKIDGAGDNRRSMGSIGSKDVLAEEHIIESDDKDWSSPLIDKNEHKENALPPVSQSHFRFNRRTPDLEKIANFFRNNRSPKQKGFLAKLESSVMEDTPVAQRRSHFLRVSDSGKSSSTEYVRRPVNVDDEASLVVSRTGIHYIYEEGRSLECSQRDFQTTNKLEFLDQGTQSQEQLEAPGLEKNRILQESHEIKSVEENRYDEVKETSSNEKDLDVSAKDKCYNKDIYDESRINDTSAGAISQWVFKPNMNEQANSNSPTQIIPAGETQEDETIDKSRRNQFTISQADETQVRSFSSLEVQEKSMEHKVRELKSPIQIVRSPEHNDVLDPQNLPSEPEALKVDVFTDALRRDSLLESREIIDIKSRSNSPTHDIASFPRSKDEKRKSFDENILFQVSSKRGSTPNFDAEKEKSKDLNDNAAIIISETECTQDLPELEEHSTDESKGDNKFLIKTADGSSEDSEDIVGKGCKRGGANKYTFQKVGEGTEEISKKKYGIHSRKRLKRNDRTSVSKLRIRTPDNTPDHDQEKRQSRKPKSANRFSSEDWLKKINDLPHDIKKKEDAFLSRRDIKFDNAVWCQYGLNYCFYPGLLISYDENADGCWVKFETGLSLTKNDDTYYLDIRVGDTVSWHGTFHKVAALECRTQDSKTIRCIRGYDTLHLRKRHASGKLEKKHSIVPLSSISLDLNEWTKRPKVILEGGLHTKAKAFRFLQNPIRGRRSISHLSPRKTRSDFVATRRQTYREDLRTELSDRITSTPDGTFELPSKLESLKVERDPSVSMEGGILRDSLFVCSGINNNLDEDNYSLSNMIRSLGGTVLNGRYSDLFDFEYLEETDRQLEKYILKLEWKSNIQPQRFRFGCLLSSKHLRSLKYLETLALGWPIVHWKFVEQCVSDGKLCTDKIHQYLLPSGESFRLMHPKEQFGVIKSNDIFQFHLRLLQNTPLKDQLGHNFFVLSSYIVVVFAHSELDQFLRFVFACLGVRILFHIPGKVGTSITPANMDVLKEYIDNILEEKKNSKIILYVNGENGLSNEKLEEHKGRICSEFITGVKTFPNLHVESKEWLIQTLINGASGFD